MLCTTEVVGSPQLKPDHAAFAYSSTATAAFPRITNGWDLPPWGHVTAPLPSIAAIAPLYSGHRVYNSPDFVLLMRWRWCPAFEENVMAWNKPKLVEVPVSMEINMYFCAKRK